MARIVDISNHSDSKLAGNHPTQQDNIRMTHDSAGARSLSETINAGKEDADNSKVLSRPAINIDPATGSQGMQMATKRQGAERPTGSSACGKKSGIKACARKKQAGRAVSLEDKPQPVDGRRSDTKKRRCSCCNDDYQNINAGTESASNTKSGKSRLPVFTEENRLSHSLSQASHPDTQQGVCDNNDQLSLGEPECFTQFSELANREDISILPRETIVPKRSSSINFSQNDAASAEATINLDSSCPLWSQISPSSSQPFSSTLLTANSGNPEIDKKTGDVLVNAGLRTTPKQSSSSPHYVRDPPRFSQLLTQASESKPGLPTTTQTSDPGMRKRKSEVLYPMKCSKEVVTVDDNQGTHSRRTNLREQILASLLEPDFEDFLAEVEEVWDEIQAGVSTTWNLKSV